jgi:dihydrofolate reductase
MRIAERQLWYDGSTAVALDPLALIVAYSVPGRIIGAAGRLPWHEPEDLRHFVACTTGHAVIMGRTTWESLAKALPRRRNLVVSRQPGYQAAGAEVFADLDAAVAAARTTDPEPVIMGGAAVYAQALPLATRLELTEVHLPVQGDTTLAPIDEAAFTESTRRISGHLVFRTLVRRLP